MKLYLNLEQKILFRKKTPKTIAIKVDFNPKNVPYAYLATKINKIFLDVMEAIKYKDKDKKIEILVLGIQ